MGRWCRRNKSLASLAGTTLFLLVMVAVVASVGYVRTTSALHGEALQRTKAQANAGLAIEALAELEDAISTLLRQLERRPEIQPPHDLLALGYSKLAIALRQAGENGLADEAARKAERERSSIRLSP